MTKKKNRSLKPTKPKFLTFPFFSFFSSLKENKRKRDTQSLLVSLATRRETNKTGQPAPGRRTRDTRLGKIGDFKELPSNTGSQLSEYRQDQDEVIWQEDPRRDTSLSSEKESQLLEYRQVQDEVIWQEDPRRDTSLSSEKGKKLPWVKQVNKALSLWCSSSSQGFGFFIGQGYRFYESRTGTWISLSSEDAMAFIALLIQNTPSLSNKTVPNKPSFWKEFLMWFEVTCRQKVPETTADYLGFTNCLVNIRTMEIVPHSRDFYCFHAVNAEYNEGPPSLQVIEFMVNLTGGDPVRLNLFRVFLNMVLTNNKGLGILPLIYGEAGSGKSTFMHLLKELSYGSCSSLTLQNWGSNFGRSAAVGSNLIIFDDLHISGLNTQHGTDMKRHVSGVPAKVDRKNKELVTMEGGNMFLVANMDIPYDRCPELRNDEGWRRRLVGVKLRKLSKSFVVIPDYERVLMKDAAGIVSWALAIPPECLTSVSRGANAITTHLEGDYDTENLDSMAVAFICEKLRLAKGQILAGGHGRESKPDSIQFLMKEFLIQQEIPLPKGRLDYKEAFLRSLDCLGLKALVKAHKSRVGWVYEGLTSSQTMGTQIVNKISPHVKVLYDTPVLTSFQEGDSIGPFEYKGMKTNEDLRGFFKKTKVVSLSHRKSPAKALPQKQK